MTTAEMEEVLSRALEKYRAWDYSELAARIEHEERTGDCLETLEGTASDGTKYFIELNAYWDDRPQGNVRIFGSLDVFPSKPVLKGLPVYVSELCLSFIMAPGGKFVGE